MKAEKIPVKQLKAETEKQILHRMISKTFTIPVFSERLKPRDFTGQNSKLFEFLINLSEAELNDMGYMAGSLSSELFNTYVDIYALTFENFFDEAYLIKKLIDVNQALFSLEISEGWYNAAKNNFQGVDFLYNIRKQCDDILRTLSDRFRDDYTFSEDLPGLLAALDRSNQEEVLYKTTGFPSFDNFTGGLIGGNLLVIAGALKNGKTSFGLNLTMDLIQQGHKASILTLEMPKWEMDWKILSYLAEVPFSHLEEKSLITADERNRIAKLQLTKNIPLHRVEKIFSEDEIIRKIKIHSERYGTKIFMIDYLGLIQSSQKYERQDIKLREIAYSLKQVAMEQNAVIIVLAQLNRDSIKKAKEGEVPSFDNLADSIGLAQAADYGLTILNPAQCKINQIELQGRKIEVQKGNFIIKPDIARNPGEDDLFLVSMDQFGRMREISSYYDYITAGSAKAAF